MKKKILVIKHQMRKTIAVVVVCESADASIIAGFICMLIVLFRYLSDNKREGRENENKICDVTIIQWRTLLRIM